MKFIIVAISSYSPYLDPDKFIPVSDLVFSTMQECRAVISDYEEANPDIPDYISVFCFEKSSVEAALATIN